MECHNSAAGQNPIDLEQLLLLWLLTSWIFYILYISAWHRLEASIVKRATQGSLTMTTPFTALSQNPTMPCTLNHNISVQLYPGSVEPKSEGGFSAQCNALQLLWRSGPLGTEFGGCATHCVVNNWHSTVSYKAARWVEHYAVLHKILQSIYRSLFRLFIDRHTSKIAEYVRELYQKSTKQQTKKTGI